MPSHVLRVNGLNLNVIVAGSGEPVILLHGFPDGSATWRNQIPALVGAGYRVIAPDLRGFGLSDRPQDVESYAMPNVISDVNGILEQLSVESAHIVGHDWGAFAAWLFAALVPSRTTSLTVLQVGHPNAFFRSGINQRRLSWYMLMFQFPGVAEDALQRDDWKLFREWLDNHPDVDSFINDLSRPGALTAALGWYRANASPAALFGAPPTLPNAKARTLAIYGDADVALTEDQVVRSESYTDGTWQYERISGASHWVHIDQPTHVNRLLIDFLGRGG